MAVLLGLEGCNANYIIIRMCRYDAASNVARRTHYIWKHLSGELSSSRAKSGNDLIQAFSTLGDRDRRVKLNIPLRPATC